MERNWNRLGRAIRESRIAQGFSQARLAELAGVARQSVLSLESGTNYSRIPPSLHKITAALGWPEGHAVAVLEENDTESATATPPPVQEPAPLLHGLPLRIIQELTQGQAVDTEVLNLPLPGSTSRMIVILKKDADEPVDPYMLQAELNEWARIQQAMRQLAAAPPPEAE